MSLIDHDHADPLENLAENVIPEPRIREPFGRYEQNINTVLTQRLDRVVPFGDVRRIDGDGVDTRPVGCRHLVAHERQQRRNDKRRPSPGFANQPGGHEVHGGLSPPGALDDKSPPPIADEGLDCLQLSVAKNRVGTPCQLG